MTTAVVYSKPGCMQCKATQRHIKKLGGSFDVVDVTQNDSAKEHLMSMGMLSMPVVETSDGDIFSGYRPGKLDEIFK